VKYTISLADLQFCRGMDPTSRNRSGWIRRNKNRRDSLNERRGEVYDFREIKIVTAGQSHNHNTRST